MTTDYFETAARAEAFRAWFEEPTTMDSIAELGAHMATWACDHLADEKVLRMEAAERASEAEARIQAVRDVLHDSSYRGAFTGREQVRADLIHNALNGDA